MIKILKIGASSLFVTLSFLSCKPVYEKVINEQYYKNETIHICDMLIFNMIHVGAFRSEYIYSDKFSNGVITSFTDSFGRLNNINFEVNNSQNAVDSSYILKRYNGSYRHPPVDSILVLAKKCEKDVVLVPLIDVTHSYAGSTVGSTYTDRLDVTAFVVKNNKVIYANSYIVESKSYNKSHDENEFKRPLDLLTQEDWDRVVKEVMQPYIDRLQ